VALSSQPKYQQGLRQSKCGLLRFCRALFVCCLFARCDILCSALPRLKHAYERDRLAGAGQKLWLAGAGICRKGMNFLDLFPSLLKNILRGEIREPRTHWQRSSSVGAAQAFLVGSSVV
jgi:hypothetical protein